MKKKKGDESEEDEEEGSEEEEDSDVEMVRRINFSRVTLFNFVEFNPYEKAILFAT